MTRIMTVCGPLEPEKLGFASMHEHILCDSRIFRKRMEPFLPPDPPVARDEPISLRNLGILRHAFILAEDVLYLNDEEEMLREVLRYRDSGGSSLLEMSVPGIRGDIVTLKRISEKSGVNIIASTGLYAYDTWTEPFRSMGVREMTAFMMDEIERGIDGSGIAPGHIKVALDSDNREPEMSAIRAAARVSAETGLPVTVHQGIFLTSSQGPVVAGILREEGADLSRVILAHCSKFFCGTALDRAITDPDSWKLNTAPAREMLDMGLNLSIDLFGHTWDAESINIINPADWQQMAGLVALIRNGYTGQLVVGTDCFMKLQLCAYGGEGYGRLTNSIMPTLRRAGVSESEIDAITVGNPARLLSVG